MQLPAITVGVLGHIAHGKTTLSAAITQLLSKTPGNPTKAQTPKALANKYPFRLPKRPVWEAPSHAGKAIGWEGRTSHATMILYQTEKARVTHFDLPGHVSRIDKIATRASFLDVAILVVSAQDGSQPQTREHVIAAARAGVSRWIVFLNYCDLVNDLDWIDEIESELRRLFLSVDVSPDEIPFIRGSASRAYEGDEAWSPPIFALLDEIDRSAQLIVRDEESPPMFVVERDGKLSVRAYGAFLGTLQRGVLRSRIGVQQDLAVFGFSAKKTKTEPIRVQLVSFERGDVDAMRAGEFAMVVSSSARREEIFGGQVIAPVGSLSTTNKFTCRVHLLTAKEGGRHTEMHFSQYAWPRVQFFINGASIEGAVSTQWMKAWEQAPPNVTSCKPGDVLEWKVELRYDLFLTPGMKVVLCDGSDGLQAEERKSRRWGGLIGWGEIVSLGE